MSFDLIFLMARSAYELFCSFWVKKWSPNSRFSRRCTSLFRYSVPLSVLSLTGFLPVRKNVSGGGGGVSLSPRGTRRIFRFAGKRTENVSPPFRQHPDRQRTATTVRLKSNPTTPTPADCIACTTSNGDIEEWSCRT